jgi:hypothetical protein
MIKKYLIILMTLVLISALFVPGVMAQENKKFLSDYSVNELKTGKFPSKELTKLNDPNAAYLSKDELLEYEELIYLMLALEGIIIENLDLGGIKKLENSEDLILAGTITYDVVFIDPSLISVNPELSNEIMASLGTQELDIFSNINKVDFAVQSISSSRAGQYYELNLYQEMNSRGETEFILAEKHLVNGNLNTMSSVISTSAVSNSAISGSGVNSLASSSGGWKDLPSNPPSGSILAYNDARASSVIAGGSIAAGVLAGLIGLIGGPKVGLGLGVVVGVATYLASSALLPRGISADFILLDFYYTIIPRPGYNASPAIGTANPFHPVYAEVDKYYVVV